MAKSINENYPFFRGNISRDDAISLLHPQRNGLFLIRDNQHFKGDYTLSVVHSSTLAGGHVTYAVEHYRIKVNDENQKKLTIDDEEFFSNLEELVKHYRADADGLVTKLTFYVDQLPKQLPQQLILNRDELTQGELIGKGNFSEVFEGVYKGSTVAVKVLNDHNAASEYLLEANVMATLDNPNLVKLIGITITEALVIVTEYMSRGCLLDYLRSRGRGVLTPQELSKFAKDTCAGMAYLESRNVVHRDLAARNILIHDDGTCKVADFGLAQADDLIVEKPSESKIAVRWTAPEASINKIFSNKSDVWSFGVVLWEIYSFGRVPYPRILIADVMKHITSGYRMNAPDGTPPAMERIMTQTWKISPSDRPTFSEILNELSSISP